MNVQPGLFWTWSETPKTDFVLTQLFCLCSLSEDNFLVTKMSNYFLENFLGILSVLNTICFTSITKKAHGMYKCVPEDADF